MKTNLNNCEVYLSKEAQKDIHKLKAANLASKAKKLIELISEDPWQIPPPYEKLIGDLKGKYSRRINIQHRLIYEVDEPQKIIKILRLWTHYE
jgi:Txe/YoeB family toxin of toxin-antitoxin system